MKSIEMRDLRERAAEIMAGRAGEGMHPLDNAVILPEEVYEQFIAALGKFADEYCRKKLCDGRGEDDQDD